MRFSLISAPMMLLLALAACEENTPPQDGIASRDTAGGSTGSGADGGGDSPPADEPPPDDGAPDGDAPPPDSGDDTPAGGDSDYVLPQAAVATLRYAGPAEDHLHVHAAHYSALGGEVRQADDLWLECFDYRLDDRPNWCDGERFRASWEEIADDINRLDEEAYGDRDVFQARAEEHFSSDGTGYGELVLRMRIRTLPSTREPAQVSRFVTTSADWVGYPAFLSVETGLPDGRPSVPSGEAVEGTLIRIYGLDEGDGDDRDDRDGWDRDDWDDDDDDDRDGHDKHDSREPRLLVETTLHGDDRYDFRLPPDSPYWHMEGPVRFTIEISQWMTITRRP